MARQTTRFILKFSLSFLLILSYVTARAQLDIKNALPDLMRNYAKAPKDTSAARIALIISNFYLNNKSHTPANIDSAYRYLAIVENLSQTFGYTKGADDARVIKASLLLAQNKTGEAHALAAKSTGSLFCRLQLVIGKYYLQKDGENQADLNMAQACFTAAQQYANAHHMPVLAIINRIYLYTVMRERSIDSRISDQAFSHIINLCKAYKSSRTEALAWYMKASYLLQQDSSIACFQRAIKAASVGKDTALAIISAKDMADISLRQGKLDTTELQLNNVLKLYTAAGYKNLQYTYDLLSAVYIARGNFETAMRYGLNAIKYAENTGTEIGINYMQYRLATLCRDMGLQKESIKWFQKCLDNTIKIENRFPYLIFRELAGDMIKNGKAEQVLKNLAKAIKKYPPDAIGVYFVPMLRADCYATLNKPAIAESYYLEVVKMFNERQIKDYYYYLSYKNIAAFYIKQKAYNKAVPYLQQLFEGENKLLPIADLAAVHQLRFKVDSAKGDYLSAIKHFESAKAITDSIFNQVRLKQTEQLQIQFETAQRDHENLVLRNKNSLQHSELEKEGLSRKLATVGFIGAVLVIGLMFYLYRAKQKSNMALQLTQREINKQNSQLNQLLQEKEWLMKEIHHRVKNNLQIISSLLNTQSSYLDNEQALAAIRDSQNRMQAISIVHQKLYLSDDLSTINLPVYIEELARSIQGSFQDRRNLTFVFELEEIRLSTADTVPLGLILNEAITNSVKYAFEDDKQGIITIKTFKTPDGACQLNISDNGKGLPADFDINNCTSLGINLMMGLTEQLSGKFSIHSNGGTLISIVFHPSSDR